VFLWGLLTQGPNIFSANFEIREHIPGEREQKPNLLAHLLNSMHKLVEVISGPTIEANAA
jgi:hypothetical protein